MSQEPRYGSEEPRQSGMMREEQENIEHARQQGSSSMTDTMQEKASDMGDRMQTQAETQKDRAAVGLEKTASKMREQMGDKGGTAGQVSDKVAGQLERTAGYLRDHETDEIWEDVEQFVKNHPMQAAVSAAVAGFVIARVLR